MAIKDSDSTVIGAGQASTIGYELRGDYPRGTVTGSVRLLAPQLAQPVLLNYEVRTKLHNSRVLLTIIVGLFQSFWIRASLQNRIALAQARTQADEIASQVFNHFKPVRRHRFGVLRPLVTIPEWP